MTITNINKIAIIFDGLGIGGIERVGINYIKLLHENGIKVDVYNLNPKLNDLYYEIDSISNIIEYKHTRFQVIENYDTKFNKYALWKYFRILPLFLFKVLFFLKRKIHTQYDLVVSFSGHFNDLQFITSNKINSYKKLTWLHGNIENYLMTNKDYLNYYAKIKNLVVLSNDNNEVLQKFPYLNIKKIYNPIEKDSTNIDIDKITSLKEIYGDYILMVARFTKQKDHKTVVKAYEHIFKNYNFRKKLVFVGDGPTIKDVKRMVNELSLNDYIIFTGSSNDVINYYESCFISVLSSPSEGLPTVLVESMISGKPVIASNSLPGVPEILNSNKIGSIFPVGDYISLSKSILRLYNNNDIYHLFKENGLERAKDFSNKRIYAELIAYINELR